ncbi:hypothetical protein [Azospirillum argentinense]|uniref:hypothetical protein n=1 Tax=Azospirillum argentinense TaxID=2970906 RepID=UPI0032DE4FE2
MRAAGRSPEFIAAAIVVDAGTIDGCKSADRIGVFAPGSDDAARRWTRVEFRGARAEIEAAEEARR